MIFRLTVRILELQGTTPTEKRTNFPHFQVDDNGRAWLVNGKIDKMTNQSNSNGNASTAALVPAPATASTSGSGTTADQSGMKRVFDTVKGQRIQRLDSVASEASTNNSDPLPVDSDFGGQSDCQSEQAYDADILNGNFTFLRDFAQILCANSPDFTNNFLFLHSNRVQRYGARRLCSNVSLFTLSIEIGQSKSI